MEPDWPNPYPKPSFQFPLPLPVADPDAAPFQSFTINCYWLPFIRGAILALAQQATWRTDDPSALLLAQQRAMSLAALFTECSGVDLPFACPFDFSAGANGWSAKHEWTGWTPDFIGQYNSLGYFENTANQLGGNFQDGVDIHTPLAALSNISSVRVQFEWAFGSHAGPLTDPAFRVWTVVMGTFSEIGRKSYNDLLAGTGTYDFTFPTTFSADEIQLQVECADGAGFSPAGLARVFAVNVTGFGRPPCG